MDSRPRSWPIVRVLKSSPRARHLNPLPLNCSLQFARAALFLLKWIADSQAISNLCCPARRENGRSGQGSAQEGKPLEIRNRKSESREAGILSQRHSCPALQVACAERNRRACPGRTRSTPAKCFGMWPFATYEGYKPFRMCVYKKGWGVGVVWRGRRWQAVGGRGKGSRVAGKIL